MKKRQMKKRKKSQKKQGKNKKDKKTELDIKNKDIRTELSVKVGDLEIICEIAHTLNKLLKFEQKLYEVFLTRQKLLLIPSYFLINNL